MNDIYITLTGNVAAEPRQYSFDEGTKVTSLKVLTSHRYFDRKTGQWTDGDKVCFTVRCWRALGDNVAASVRSGHPVVVSGRLRIREFGTDGDRRFMPEIEASSVGHDLRWGTGVFTKPERGGNALVSREMRERLDEETRDWAMGTRPQRPLGRPGFRDDNEQPSTYATDRHPASHSSPADSNTRPPLPNGSNTRPLAADGGDPRTLFSDADGVRPPVSDGRDVRTLGPDGGARPLAAGAGDMRTLVQDGGGVHTLLPHDETRRTPAPFDATAEGSSSNNMATRTQSPAEGAVHPLDPDDGAAHLPGWADGTTHRPAADAAAPTPTSMGGKTPRTRRATSDTARTPKPEADDATIRVLNGTEADDAADRADEGQAAAGGKTQRKVRERAAA
ncbi:single-stranded DNA-binding protein [Nonomuraea fuscirosea]|uniref:single-stranded DNA-binding protein n=1 Tax=Nonomuraea fuscirosea TaxID=1291556 RepID=UPI0034453236